MIGNAYKRILERLPEGVFAFDEKLRIKFMNAAFRRSFFVQKNKPTALNVALSCDKSSVCGANDVCAFCVFYRGMKKTVETGKEQTEVFHTTVQGADRADTISTRIRFFPPAKKGGLYIGVTNEEFHSERERELLSAQKMQQRLLPAGKQVAGVPYAFTYVPCLEVGGDMPDVYELDGEAYGVLADVSGKGVSAGILSAFVKAGFDRSEKDLGVALSKLNAKFNEIEQDERSYITLTAVRIDKQTGVLRYAVAGHNVPILLKNKYGINEIESPAPPISNWFGNPTYEEREFPFENGDMLVLLTDGVTECKNPLGEQFGIERAESVLLQSRSAEDFVAKLKTALTVFSGGTFSDDVTVIAFDL